MISVFQVFVQEIGKPLPYKIVERRAGDIEQIWADSSKANWELNWRADMPIQTVLKSAWEWELRLALDSFHTSEDDSFS